MIHRLKTAPDSTCMWCRKGYPRFIRSPGGYIFHNPPGKLGYDSDYSTTCEENQNAQSQPAHVE